MAPPQPSISNPPYRRSRPPHNRHAKPKTSSTASTASSPTPTATPVIKAASTKVIHAQMERFKGPLNSSPPSSELEVHLKPSARSKSVFKDKHVQDKRRTIPTRKAYMTSPDANTLLESDKKSPSTNKPHDVLTSQKRPIRIVDPADREPRGEIKVKTALDSASAVEKPKLVSTSVPSFYDDSPSYTSPTMPQYAPSTPPRFRNSSNNWGPGGSPYGAAYNRSPVDTQLPPSAHLAYPPERSVSAYLEQGSNPSPEPLRPTPPPIPATSAFERRLRLYRLMPNLKTLQESDYPPPAPYNAAFPHPVSAYASPGVNQHSLAASGYLGMLQDLVQNDPAKLKGSILASASEKEDLWPPALDMVLAGDDGCGIPERLFVQFDSLGAARISVGTATPAPYARIKPLSGSPPSFRSGIGEQGILGHSQDEFVVSHFTSRRPTFPDQASWQRDSQRVPYEPSLVDWRGIGGRDETSPDFKTEVCPVWEDTGLCKYGKSCQFAHGFNELRTPSRILPLPSPPLEQAQMHDKYLPEGTFPFPSSQRKASLPSLPIRSRLDIRRASAPPRDLSVVTEIEDQQTPSWQQEDLPPIGAERITTSREKPREPLPNLIPSHAWQSCDFDSSASPTPRPAILHPYTHQGSHHLQELQTSISSLSSSDHSTPYTLSSEAYSNHWSPSDRSSVQAGSYSSKGQNEHVESDATWSRSAASTTIDFSTGRSIWC